MATSHNQVLARACQLLQRSETGSNPGGPTKTFKDLHFRTFQTASLVAPPVGPRGSGSGGERFSLGPSSGRCKRPERVAPLRSPGWGPASGMADLKTIGRRPSHPIPTSVSHTSARNHTSTPACRLRRNQSRRRRRGTAESVNSSWRRREPYIHAAVSQKLSQA